MANIPPTIVVVHPRERRSKCTVEPLRGRPGFLFLDFPPKELPDLSRYVRLGIDGVELTSADATKGLLVLDATWRYAARMEQSFAAVPVRGLPPWRTAYPRVSKVHADPETGLATIEAIFAAYTILGRDTTGLLDHYHWSAGFLTRNADRLQS